MFQFTHPVRGATPCCASKYRPACRFNSRTPCGVRLVTTTRSTASSKFQFTHPVRGATLTLGHTLALNTFQFTHPVRGATTSTNYSRQRRWFQFTHPVRGATITADKEISESKFQFTHPVRGATPAPLPRARAHKGFNSRTPCGVRQRTRLYAILIAWFQFTHPVRGATR